MQVNINSVFNRMLLRYDIIPELVGEDDLEVVNMYLMGKSTNDIRKDIGAEYGMVNYKILKCSGDGEQALPRLRRVQENKAIKQYYLQCHDINKVLADFYKKPGNRGAGIKSGMQRLNEVESDSKAAQIIRLTKAQHLGDDKARVRAYLAGVQSKELVDYINTISSWYAQHMDPMVGEMVSLYFNGRSLKEIGLMFGIDSRQEMLNFESMVKSKYTEFSEYYTSLMEKRVLALDTRLKQEINAIAKADSNKQLYLLNNVFNRYALPPKLRRDIVKYLVNSASTEMNAEGTLDITNSRSIKEIQDTFKNKIVEEFKAGNSLTKIVEKYRLGDTNVRNILVGTLGEAEYNRISERNKERTYGAIKDGIVNDFKAFIPIREIADKYGVTVHIVQSACISELGEEEFNRIKSRIAALKYRDRAELKRKIASEYKALTPLTVLAEKYELTPTTIRVICVEELGEEEFNRIKDRLSQLKAEAYIRRNNNIANMSTADIDKIAEITGMQRNYIKRLMETGDMARENDLSGSDELKKRKVITEVIKRVLERNSDDELLHRNRNEWAYDVATDVGVSHETVLRAGALLRWFGLKNRTDKLDTEMVTSLVRHKICKSGELSSTSLENYFLSSRGVYARDSIIFDLALELYPDYFNNMFYIDGDQSKGFNNLGSMADAYYKATQSTINKLTDKGILTKSGVKYKKQLPLELRERIKDYCFDLDRVNRANSGLYVKDDATRSSYKRNIKVDYITLAGDSKVKYLNNEVKIDTILRASDDIDNQDLNVVDDESLNGITDKALKARIEDALLDRIGLKGDRDAGEREA